MDIWYSTKTCYNFGKKRRLYVKGSTTTCKGFWGGWGCISYRVWWEEEVLRLQWAYLDSELVLGANGIWLG